MFQANKKSGEAAVQSRSKAFVKVAKVTNFCKHISGGGCLVLQKATRVASTVIVMDLIIHNRRRKLKDYFPALIHRYCRLKSVQ